MHAMGRYVIICGGTGRLPPSLMGIWGNQMEAALGRPLHVRRELESRHFGGLARQSAGGHQYLHCFPRTLSRTTGGKTRKSFTAAAACVTDLCQGWRHGSVLMPTYPWTGGAGWLVGYLYDHYLFTRTPPFWERTSCRS